MLLNKVKKKRLLVSRHHLVRVRQPRPQGAGGLLPSRKLSHPDLQSGIPSGRRFNTQPPSGPSSWLLPSLSTRGQTLSRLLPATHHSAGRCLFGGSAGPRAQLFKHGFRAGRHLSGLQRQRIPPPSPWKLMPPHSVFRGLPLRSA